MTQAMWGEVARRITALYPKFAMDWRSCKNRFNNMKTGYRATVDRESVPKTDSGEGGPHEPPSPTKEGQRSANDDGGEPDARTLDQDHEGPSAALAASRATGRAAEGLVSAASVGEASAAMGEASAVPVGVGDRHPTAVVMDPDGAGPSGPVRDQPSMPQVHPTHNSDRIPMGH